MKKSKGVTLVALIITIILLLILAGITISGLTNGRLFENTKLAKEKYEKSQEKEQISLAYTNVKLEKNKNVNDNVEASELQNKLEQNGNKGASVTGDDVLTVIMPSGNKYIVTSDGEISEKELQKEPIIIELANDLVQVGTNTVINISVKDGLNITPSKYIYSNDSEEYGVNAEEWNTISEDITDSTIEIENLKEGYYYVHILVKEEGVDKEYILDKVTVATALEENKVTFRYTGKMETFIPYYNGRYKIECWGTTASDRAYISSTNYQAGAYVGKCLKSHIF